MDVGGEVCCEPITEKEEKAGSSSDLPLLPTSHAAGSRKKKAPTRKLQIATLENKSIHRAN